VPQGRFKEHPGFPREAPPFPVRQFLDAGGKFLVQNDGFCGFHTTYCLSIYETRQVFFSEKMKKSEIFFTRTVDNGIMGKSRKVDFRIDTWMFEAINREAKTRGLTFSDMVNKFLRQELEYRGYTEGKYDAETYGIGREATGGSEAGPAGKKNAG
jgi:hypothetical protein